MHHSRANALMPGPHQMNPYRSFYLATILAAGCSTAGYAVPLPSRTPPAIVRSPLAGSLATSTVTPLPTITATATSSPAVTPSPTWVAQGPGHIQVPILMYHHVEVAPIDSYLRVSASRFEDEIRLLRDWQYTPITTTILVQAITKGASLPARPVIITFDDANENTYTTAFPIMKKYGFTGVLYVPYDYIGAPSKLTVDQIKEMLSVGWEVGSHTLSHPPNFLALDPASMRAEIVDSRKRLSALLGVPILTFAYPFGDNSSASTDYVIFAGYIAAMGATGFTADQGPGNLFVLQRCEIKGSDDAKTMTRFLPWLGDPAFLPTDTPTPTPRPTRTPIPTYTQYPTKTPKLSPTP